MARTYLVRRGADAEDEPRGEVGPGDVRGRGPRRRPDADADPERGQEEENSTAERLPHHVQRAGRPQWVSYRFVRRSAALAGGVVLYI